MGFFLEVLIGGLLAGVLYSLVALGFVLCANVSGVVNFAQGEFVMLGGMAGAAGQYRRQPAGQECRVRPHNGTVARVLSAKIVALTATLTPISINPSPRATVKLPILVSSTIAVVIVRV